MGGDVAGIADHLPVTSPRRKVKPAPPSAVEDGAGVKGHDIGFEINYEPMTLINRETK
jgi:hypothetical protein